MAMRRKNGARNLEDFPLDTEMSKPHRIAAFLDWWAKKAPYDFAMYNEVLKAIEGYKRLPRLDTEEVDSLRGRIGSAERIVHEKYRRAVVRHRGLGVRATVDDVDVVRHKSVDRTRKVERAIVALARQDEIVDVNKIPNTPENRALKQWYNRDVKGILKQIAAPEFLAKMLPPGSKEKDEAAT